MARELPIENKGKAFKIFSRIFLLIAIPIAATYIVATTFAIPAFSIELDTIKSYITSFRYFAPIVYIVFQALTVPLVPVPSVILATAGGVLFGFLPAVIYTTISWVLGTSINFFLSRIFGRPLLQRLLNADELVMVDRFANKMGWKLVFITWFAPGGTADIVGYAAGLTKIAYLRYVSAIFPAALLLAIVTSAAGATVSINPVFVKLFTVIGILGIVFTLAFAPIYSILTHILRRFRKDKVI